MSMPPLPPAGPSLRRAAGLAARLRGLDVRVVLGVAAFLLFLAAGQPARFVASFVKEMANERTIVPIGSAMGFAYALKLTGCDRHLVHLLLRPLRRAGALLIPGGVAAAFLVNGAIVSQTSTAATVGIVLIPLLLGAGISAPAAGATLLLGSSMGGEQLNPGAVEIITLAGLTGLPPEEVVRRVLRPNLLASGVALLAFLWLARRGPGAREAEGSAAAPALEAPPRVRLVQAAVPLVPLALLFLLPHGTLVPDGQGGGAAIAAAMLVGLVCAGLAAPSAAPRLGAAFFEGAGYAYTHVISLIVIATTFTEAIKALGWIEALGRGLGGRPSLLILCAVVLPGALAALTGTGIAPAVALMKVLVPLSAPAGVDPARLGALISVSAQFGRTMSPAAAVVIMAATLAGAPPGALLRRAAPALLFGAAALLLGALLRLV